MERAADRNPGTNHRTDEARPTSKLDDSVKPTSAHNALNTIVENGKEVKILRENMAFGSPGQG